MSSRRPPDTAGSKLVRDAGAYARFARELPRFMRRRMTLDAARTVVEHGLRDREERFLAVLERGIYANRRSPVRALLEHAGAQPGDVARLVREHGLEGALARLHDEGVHVTLDEFKGRRPIERPGLVLETAPEDFDNPLVEAAYTGATGGSGGAARRVAIDLDLVEYEAAYQWLMAAAFPGIHDRPIALWRPVPPGSAGLRTALRFAKRGVAMERWFSQNRLTPRGGTAREYVFTWTAILASRRFGAPIPTPEHVPPEGAERVARWLAAKAAGGTPGFLSTPASAAVRACLVAKEHGLDIAGSWLRVGGEPFTEGKAKVAAELGCRMVPGYSMTEVGRIGVACAAPAALDDVHLVTDKLAVVQPGLDAAGGARALLYTTIHPRCPKLLVNVESGDTGVLVERDCGCPVGEVGLRLHAHTIRSAGKLTSEGMNLLATDLVPLVEEVLPARFGGSPTDYQLVEEERGGLSKVTVVVAPRVGPIDEREVLRVVLVELGSGPAYRRMMADVWARAGTLGVLRREPYTTGGAKILPLHVVRRG